MKYNILGLNISMNDSIGVKFIHCLTNLPHDVSNILFRHTLMFFQLFEELTSRSNFQNDVDFGSIIKKSEHPDDVRVVQIHLYFQFSDKLLCNLFFFQKFFFYDFQSADKICFFFSNQEHMPILSFSQFLELFKIRKF